LNEAVPSYVPLRPQRAIPNLRCEREHRIELWAIELEAQRLQVGDVVLIDRSGEDELEPTVARARTNGRLRPRHHAG